MSLLKSIRDYIDALVHPSAQHDALTASRHRAFIAPRLIGSVVALASFPIYLALRGVPSVLEVLVFVWLVAPILTAYYLSRTGQYESAHVLSSLALTGLVTAVAAESGGITSFAAIWLVIVPLEAALSASRRVVAMASTFAIVAAGLLLFLGTQNMLPAGSGAESGALAALGIISAALYATGLGLGAESLARTSFWLLYAEEDRYRLLAQNMTDVITRHGNNGAVLFVSPAAETLFGVKVAELQGHKLFDRVHVADRPAYLTALADAASLGEARSVEFRVRRDDEAAGPKSASHFIWVEMRCRPLDHAVGNASATMNEVVAVMRDVTERKLQEQAVEEARAEAEKANAAKGRFLATMSHELRTPLNAIIGFSDMLKQEEAMRLDQARRHEYAHLINESGTHLLSVVNGILDMSKMETGNFEITPEPFAPAQAVTASLQALGWLQAQGARQFYFKYCSTFDSWYQGEVRGNIGPVTEALMAELGTDFTIATPAFPDNGRTVFKGHLFVGDVLLSDSGMKDHPLTPMRDANLVRVMQAQCQSKVGLIDHKTIAAGAAAVTLAIDQLKSQGVRIAIVDAVSNDDLIRMGPALRDLPLLTAGSGVAIALPANFGLQADPRTSLLPAAGGRQAIVSGSCSQATLGQVQHAMKQGVPAWTLDPAALMDDAGQQQAIANALQFASQHATTPVLVYSSAAPDAVRAIQQRFGVEQAGTTGSVKARIRMKGTGNTLRDSLATSNGRIAIILPKGTFWTKYVQLAEFYLYLVQLLVYLVLFGAFGPQQRLCGLLFFDQLFYFAAEKEAVFLFGLFLDKQL